MSQGTVGTCRGASDGLDGVAADARPVVLVHGWRGSALSGTRTALETEIGRNGWQFFLFDYHRASAQWAADEDVAGCLADYMHQVSQAHENRGGDGRVHVVAHSMGGLAARFAVEDRPDLASRIAGVVTLGTPHTGSPWGNSGLPTAVVDAVNRWTLDALPEGSSRASVCLAVHRAGQDLPVGCEPPPYLPASVPVTQVEGAATISRTFFGFHAYDILLAGDSIVPSESASGYLGSAQGPTAGMKVRIRTVPCRADARALLAEAGARTLNPITGLSAALAQLHVDGTAMDAVMAGTASPALGELVGIANLVMPCSHVRIPTSPQAITAVAEALREDAPAAGGRRVDVSDEGGGAFYTPSGNIVCEMAARAARCDIRDKAWTLPEPPGCELDFGATLILGDRAEVGCVGDTIAYSASVSTDNSFAAWYDARRDPTVEREGAGRQAALSYGSTMVNGDVSCTVSRQGVACTNDRTGAGFTMSRGAYAVAPPA